MERFVAIVAIRGVLCEKKENWFLATFAKKTQRTQRENSSRSLWFVANFARKKDGTTTPF
ncbi:MAG: hypothetical protein Q8N83_06640 [Ignavibacteria bacterium]|nr:hypothetical protein [Ignavibacteria bacterium]